jgi:phytoene synthase
MKSQSNGMVNQSLQTNDTAAAPNGDRSLAILAVPSRHRPAIETLFALDARLAGIVRATREPMVGQMRLTWWHEALTKLDGAPAPAEPLLRDVQQHLLPAGVSGARLAGMIDGWEELIVADALGAETLDRHAGARGAGLFAAAGMVLGADSPLLVPAGRGWALADLAGHLSAPTAAGLAADAARRELSHAFSAPWPAKLRPIGVLSLIARLDATPGSALAKALKVGRFRITGR